MDDSLLLLWMVSPFMALKENLGDASTDGETPSRDVRSQEHVGQSHVPTQLGDTQMFSIYSGNLLSHTAIFVQKHSGMKIVSKLQPPA